ncbi:MAG: hypothetical protein ABWW65_03305 [Thermoprotei archaeon]
MSLSTPLGNTWFFRLLGKFRVSKDPVAKNIHAATITIDRMLNFIESTRKNLENMYEEHQRRARLFAEEGKEEYEKIFVEESKHIASLIALFSKVHFDLMRVKYRLQTIMTVEEPMKLLPEIIQELEMIRPEIERIAPELTTMLIEVERRVNSVMAASSLDSITTSRLGSYSKDMSVKERLPPLPPQNKPLPSRTSGPVISKRILSIDDVKRLLLEEIRNKGGVLVVSDFAKKYNIPKHMVYVALNELEREGVIKVKK